MGLKPIAAPIGILVRDNQFAGLRSSHMAGEGGHRTCEYELDPAGNRLSVTDKDSKYIKFGLDPKYQLTNETQWSAKTPGTRNLQYAYVMDPNGNRLFQHKDGVVTSYTIGDNNEVTNISGIGAIDYDHYGSVIAYSDVSLTYDFERHMTHIEDENAHTDDHEYDGNGRRMRSKLNGAANWTHFIHDELTEQILCEYTLISSTFTIKSINTYGIGLISTNRESTKRYFHFDGLGSTRALTDSSQVVQDTYNFSAFGIRESSTGSSVNPYRFLGQVGCYDDSSKGSTFGLVLKQVTYYWPTIGRLLSGESPLSAEATVSQVKEPPPIGSNAECSLDNLHDCPSPPWVFRENFKVRCCYYNDETVLAYWVEIDLQKFIRTGTTDVCYRRIGAPRTEAVCFAITIIKAKQPMR